MILRRNNPATQRNPPVDCHATGLNRCGALLVEMVVCCVLLSTITVVLAPLIRSVHQQQNMSRFETLALTTLNNIASDLQAGQGDSAVEMEDWFSQRYPDAKLVIETLETDPPQTPLKITVRRPHPNGVGQQQRSMVVWLEASE